MKQFIAIVFSFAISLLFSRWKSIDDEWIKEKHKVYVIYYKSADKQNIKEYKNLIRKGILSVNGFFNSSYVQPINVYVHPDRRSLDNTWQNDWKMPGFKSECWMVASGVAERMDMISPKHWDKEACEHKYAETTKTQLLITHELVHVYHGQKNASPDFNNVERMDWFIEGLASYASGQCNDEVIKEINKAIIDNKIPGSLDDFWTGHLRYGLSGSVVMFIDKKYGRSKLKQLLGFNKKEELLKALNTSEADLLNEWKDYLIKL